MPESRVPYELLMSALMVSIESRSTKAIFQVGSYEVVSVCCLGLPGWYKAETRCTKRNREASSTEWS